MTEFAYGAQKPQALLDEEAAQAEIAAHRFKHEAVTLENPKGGLATELERMSENFHKLVNLNGNISQAVSMLGGEYRDEDPIADKHHEPTCAIQKLRMLNDYTEKELNKLEFTHDALTVCL